MARNSGINREQEEEEIWDWLSWSLEDGYQQLDEGLTRVIARSSSKRRSGWHGGAWDLARALAEPEWDIPFGPRSVSGVVVEGHILRP